MITTINDKIAVKIIPEEDTGIVKIAKITHLPYRGTIISAGNGKMSDCGKLSPPLFNVGDIVVFTHYTAILEENGEKYAILPEDDVIVRFVAE